MTTLEAPELKWHGPLHKEKHQTKRETVHGLVYGHPRVDMLTETMLQSMTAYIIDSAATLWYVYYGKSHVFSWRNEHTSFTNNLLSYIPLFIIVILDVSIAMFDAAGGSSMITINISIIINIYSFIYLMIISFNRIISIVLYISLYFPMKSLLGSH